MKKKKNPFRKQEIAIILNIRSRTKSPSAFGHDKYGLDGKTWNVDPEWLDSISQKNKIPSVKNSEIWKKIKNNKNYSKKVSESTKYTTEQKEQIRVMFEWGGCAITPQYCALIKGINLAYKIYRTDNNDMVKEIAKIIASDVVPIVSEYQVDACSNKIVEQINDYGLIDNIFKQTNLDKSVFQDMMKGTISNLLNAGMKNQVTSTIGKM